MSDREVSAVGLHRGAMPVIAIGMGLLLNNLWKKGLTGSLFTDFAYICCKQGVLRFCAAEIIPYEPDTGNAVVGIWQTVFAGRFSFVHGCLCCR